MFFVLVMIILYGFVIVVIIRVGVYGGGNLISGSFLIIVLYDLICFFYKDICVDVLVDVKFFDLMVGIFY